MTRPVSPPRRPSLSASATGSELANSQAPPIDRGSPDGVVESAVPSGRPLRREERRESQCEDPSPAGRVAVPPAAAAAGGSVAGSAAAVGGAGVPVQFLAEQLEMLVRTLRQDMMELVEHSSRELRHELDQGLREFRAQLNQSSCTAWDVRRETDFLSIKADADAVIAEMKSQTQVLRTEGEARASLTEQRLQGSRAAVAELAEARLRLEEAKLATAELTLARQGYMEIKEAAELSLANLNTRSEKIAPTGETELVCKELAAVREAVGEAVMATKQAFTSSHVSQVADEMPLQSVVGAATTGNSLAAEKDLLELAVPLHKELAKLATGPSLRGPPVCSPLLLEEVMEAIQSVLEHLKQVTREVLEASEASIEARQDSGLALRGCKEIRGDVRAIAQKLGFELPSRVEGSGRGGGYPVVGAPP